jgi:hypothetical protein
MMPNMPNMPNEALVKELRELACRERKLTREILICINEFERRKLHLELGYSSVIEWLIGELHYSEGAAYRRVNAARVLRDVPSVAEKIQNGSLTLSSLATLQSAIQSEERRTHAKITPKAKQDLTARLEKKSKLETAKVLGSVFPELNLERRDELRPVSATESRLVARVSEETRVSLERVRELLSHAMPEASWGEIIERLADDYLKRHDPLLKPRANSKRDDPSMKLSGAKPDSTKARSQTGSDAEANKRQARPDEVDSRSTQDDFAAKSPCATGTQTATSMQALPSTQTATSAQTGPSWQTGPSAQIANNSLTTGNTTAASSPPNAAKTRKATIRPGRKAISVRVDRAVMQRDDGRCQILDPRTGRICGSRWQVELDHIKPWALGGADTAENLRCVCRRHNARRAEKMFGPWKKR